MLARRIKAEDLVGRKIVRCDDDCVNRLKLEFEDGGELEIWVEPMGYGLYGMMTYENSVKCSTRTRAKDRGSE